jgi:hypothetical protein
MRNKIFKIMGVGLTLVIAMALVMGFAAPAAASPGETINEWYNFDYPGPGADDGWLYDPSIIRVGEITEAIDGTLYVHVQRCIDDLAFDNATGTMTITEFGTSDTGLVVAEIDGDWDGPETDFVAFLNWDNTAGAGTMCISGTITATHLSFTGSMEALGGDLVDWTHVVTDGGFTVEDCGFSITGPYGNFGGWDVEEGYDIYFDGVTNLGSSIFKSTDKGRTWEDTDFPGGWVVDMAASSLDADILYVADGYYVYKTADAGDSWNYVKKDSLEEQLSGACHIPPCCYCGQGYAECCPSCSPPNVYLFTCPITSIDVTYDDSDNPYIFIGTRKHCSGIDLDDPPDDLDFFPGEVYWICEGGYPSNWSGLGLDCYRSGTYDALAVGCAPDWADTNETYVVVTTDDDNGDDFPGDPDDLQTHVVVTTGGPCDWPEYAELLWDCTTPFASAYASRIAFPDDWEDTETLFVGVTDCAYCADDCWEDTTDVWLGCGGDVYMVMDGSAYDMNVLGISTGCIGVEAVDIISLDIEGDTEEARLIAGAFCCNKVYCSEDGGWSWDASDKDPTGAILTYAIWYEDTALAVTSGCECAVSMCCGEDYPCEFWNQISLIGTSMGCVRWIDHSPGYVCGDTETMFMLTNWNWFYYWGDSDYCCFPCQMCGTDSHPTCYDETQSVWRYDGTYWERVYSSTIAGANACCEYDPDDPSGCTHAGDIFWRLQVSPDFNTTNAVYLWNGCFEMWRTTDAGCSWTKLTFPCAPRPCIRTAVVIDEDTVIAGGLWDCGDCCDAALGYVYKTTRHGARPWSEYEFDATHEGEVISLALEPGYEDPGSVLLGDDESGVYISEDGGETWDLVGDCKTVLEETEDAWVIFDPGYATNHIIYAAAGYAIARCQVDFDADWADQTWELICDHGGYAYGIQAAGDTALYVLDGIEIRECEDVEDPCCSDGVADYGGVLRSLNPDAEDASDVIFERLANGLPLSEAEPYRLWLTCDTSDEGCAENVLWAIDDYHCENIWVWEDTLAAPVVLAMPIDAQKLGKTDQATLSWNSLCGADCYEVALWKYCAECPDERLDVALALDCAPDECCIACAPTAVENLCACPAGKCVCTSDTCIVVSEDTTGTALERGTEYHWQVRVCLCQPFLSKWSEERTFMTALVPVVELCSPVCGGQDIILTPNFSWDEVDGATGYDIELATTQTFTAGVVRGSSTVNAWVAPEPLEYATTYYWRVRAKKDGLFSDWTVCIFTTMAEPVEPPPPVTITPAPPAPQVNIPPAEMITPNWIYAIIGIGAALCVVVIVLIVRTRRPPA